MISGTHLPAGPAVGAGLLGDELVANHLTSQSVNLVRAGGGEAVLQNCIMRSYIFFCLIVSVISFIICVQWLHSYMYEFPRRYQ